MKLIKLIIAFSLAGAWMETGWTKTLDDIRIEFFEKQLDMEPVTAWFWGISKYADKIRLDDDELRNEERKFYTRLLADLESYPEDLLTIQDRIDVRIMKMMGLWSLLNIEEMEPLGWRSSADISYLIDQVYQNVMRQKGKSQDWDVIVKKMRMLPSVIRQQQKNLEDGIRGKAPFYKREVQREAIDLVDEVVKYFRNDVVEAAKKSLSASDFKKFLPQLKSSTDELESTLQIYVQFLKSNVLPVSKDDSFAIGEVEYAWRLRNMLFSSETPESLFKYGKARVDATEKEMKALAEEISQHREGKKKTLPELMDELQKTAPASDAEMVEMYKDTVKRAVTFIREKKLFRLPADYTIDLLETPEAYRNVLSVAAMNPVPPFADGIPAQFWVTPTRDEKNPQGNPKLLAENHSRLYAPNLVAHEAVPGHDMQLGFSARRFIAGGRNDLSFEVRQFTPDPTSSLGVEGWAHYAEQLMAEEGFFTPEERLFQLKDAQWRNARIVVDIGIHTGRMSYSEAVKYFNDKTFSGETTAEREIYRYSKWPLQAITYHLGKRDILELRSEVQKIAGKGFDLAHFHELLLSYDGVPVSLFHDELISKYNARIAPLEEKTKKRTKRRAR